MSNTSARPGENRGPRLHPWDSDSARYHCQRLRALADLILAGEPAQFINSSSGSGDDELLHLTVVVNHKPFIEAEIAVGQRVQAGQDDYAIRTTPRPRSIPPRSRKRR